MYCYRVLYLGGHILSSVAMNQNLNQKALRNTCIWNAAAVQIDEQHPQMYETVSPNRGTRICMAMVLYVSARSILGLGVRFVIYF